MSDKPESEKDLPATERKIQKAREEGQIPRSKDFAGALVVLVAIFSLFLMSSTLIDNQNSFMTKSLTFGAREAKSPSVMAERFADLLIDGFLGLAPYFIIVMVAAVVGSVMLGGFLFTTKSLEPKFSKMNPLKGLKNMVSANAGFELIKSIVKVLCVGVVAYFTLRSNMDAFPAMMNVPLPETMATAASIAIKDALILAFAYMIVVVGDMPLQQHKHLKQLKMDHEEVKKEHKDTDGDPLIKSRIRQIQQQMSRKRMMAAIPTADVIVTNPTHFAVALKYKNGKGAPTVVAKGLNEVAFKIREIGAENKVPVVEAPPLARALYKNVDLDRQIPTSLYTAVAKLLAYVYSIADGQVDESFLPTAEDIPDGLDPGPRE